MDLRTFFERFILEHEMVRANLIHATSFADQQSFIDFKMEELVDESCLRDISRHMSITEMKLIKHLFHSTPDQEQLHTVDYNVDSYTTLIDSQYILENAHNSGVIHDDIVGVLYQALASSGLMPSGEMYVKDESAFPDDQQSGLKDIYTGPIYWFYNNFKFVELRKILSRLNVKPDGQYKEDYINQLIPVITDPEYLKHALLTLEDNEYKTVRDQTLNGRYIYRRHSRWTAAKKVGLLVDVHRDYLAIHESVAAVLKTIDFNALDKVRTKSYRTQVDDYNAYHLELKIAFQPEDIIREIYMPAGMNFYELERVIKAAMGFKVDDGSYFKTDSYRIYSTELEKALEKGSGLTASYTQIDALLDLTSQLSYEYNPNAGYSIEITLKKFINIDRRMPEVTAYSGPVPIDNIGGIEKLNDVMEILQDTSHADYVRVYEKVRRLNYRTRYPMRAINKRLRTIFRKSYPLTEFNE